jgi:hypothetical protein
MHGAIAIALVFFGLMAAIFGLRGAALIVVWLIVSVIVWAQLQIPGWGGFFVSMMLTALPFLLLVGMAVAGEVRRQRLDGGSDDDAILREAVRRAQRDEEDRQHNMAVLRQYFADEMERRLKKDGYFIPPNN